TNTFSAAGLLNAAVSLTHGKSSYVDSSQLPDGLNMPELEDITYFDDEDNVVAEADFNNLETSITVISLILTTRVHKDHPVIQIIGYLSSTTQTRSMTRVAKDQSGLSQINNNDFHTCMFACFLPQEEPKRVHQALKDRSWIEAIQEELLQFKMQKGTIEEEVYVCQPPGFEDPDYPDKPTGNPTFSSHPELTSSEVKDDIFDLEGGNVLPEKLLDCWDILCINPLYLDTVSFGVDAAKDFKENMLSV
nr:hypothetical protein [Tanacetum cinerariifolium]